jgi:Rieske Fe-S protein
MATPSHNPAGGSGEAAPSRRGFLARAGAIVIGAFIVLVPAASSLAVLLDPLRRRGNGGRFLPVAPLEAVPDDGSVRQFPVIAQRIDAWNRTTEPVGAVYLRRAAGAKVPECLSAICPHAGCFVAYDSETSTFKCPCHNSSYTAEGAIIAPSPSPRPMDTLECKVAGDEILVKYENFYTGRADKVVKQ